MSTNLEDRRKEALLLLLTVIVLALLVSLLSDIIYERYISVNREVFLTIVLVSLLIIFVITYFIIIGTTSEVITTIMFPFCFNNKVKTFIDIERCVPSVHARIHFNRLAPGYQKELAKQAQNKYEGYWRSDLENFLNDVVQAILLDLLFDGNSAAVREAIDLEAYEKVLLYKDFPETIKRNDVIRRENDFVSQEFEAGYNLLLPRWAKFNTFGELERFIQIHSMFGKLTIAWDIAPSNTAYNSAPYLTALDIDPEEDAHEYEVNIVLTYNCKHIYVHTKMLREYLIWTQKIQRRFSELDWSVTREQLPLVIMQLWFNRMQSEN